MNLSEMFKTFKGGIEEKILFLEHQQTVQHLRLSRDCFGVKLSTNFYSNFKTSIFLISLNFTNPLRKIISSQTSPKITQKLTKHPET